MSWKCTSDVSYLGTCADKTVQVSDGKAAYKVRAAMLAAGYPYTAGASSVNRFCSSGLLSVQNVATAIMAGAIDVGIATGVESMSLNADKPPTLSEKIMNHPIAKDNVMPMGWTSENVAADFNITREQQDTYAARSHARAERAQREGWTKDEIVPVTTKKGVIEKDDGIRQGTTKEGLGKIRSAFPQWAPSTTTGGNASQITDGAAGVVLMKRSKAQELGLPILGKYGKFICVEVCGTDPGRPTRPSISPPHFHQPSAS